MDEGALRTGIATGLRAQAGGFARRMLDLVLPPLCMACARPVTAHGALCTACWNGMDFIARPYCQRLGTPFEADLGMDLISPRAIADPPVFSRVRGVARHEGTARALIHRLKYSDRLDVADTMGRMMANAGSELLGAADVLVPVPLHAMRMMRRRFNQAGALAAAVARQSGRVLEYDALKRVKATPSQVGLSAQQRRRNLAGAFVVPEAARGLIAGRRILVIDDVMTTSSTLNAAARALRKAGAADVDALVFAIVAERV